MEGTLREELEHPGGLQGVLYWSLQTFSAKSWRFQAKLAFWIWIRKGASTFSQIRPTILSYTYQPPIYNHFHPLIYSKSPSVV